MSATTKQHDTLSDDALYGEALGQGNLGEAQALVDKEAACRLAQIFFRDYPRQGKGVYMDIGHWNLRGEAHVATIHNLDVDKDKRGRGWGSEALNFAIALADKMGVVLDLEMGGGEDAEPGFDLPRWYGRHGFAPRGDCSMARQPVGSNPPIAYDLDGHPIPPSKRFLDDGTPVVPLRRGAGKEYAEVVEIDPSEISWMDRDGSGGSLFQLKDGRKVSTSVPLETFFEDRDYYEAVTTGDKKTAERLLDNAAKSAGYVVGPVFHGTSNGGFKEFAVARPRKNETLSFGIHFWRDKALAERYASDPDVARKGGRTPEVREVYLAANNPLDVERIVEDGTPEFALAKQIAKKNFIACKNEAGVSIAYLKNNIDDAPAERTRLMLMEAGYDSILYKGDISSITPYKTRAVSGKGDAILVFSPEQIKPAAVDVRDENGRLIPLSQRFPPRTTVQAPALGGRSLSGPLPGREQQIGVAPI